MRAAPAFELHITPARGERVVLTLIGGLCASVLASWVWSHIDAAVGPVGRRALPWMTAGAGGALLGALSGWMLAPRGSALLSWRQGSWARSRSGAPALECTVQAKVDLGRWLLLRMRPADGGPVGWLGVGRGQAGVAWHAMRATLFAPGHGAQRPGPDEGLRA